MSGRATFSLFFRHLPDDRNFIVSCGIEDVIDYLCSLRFQDDDLEWLTSTGRFSERFIDYLSTFRFTGEMVGVPDGTPVFPNEPLLEVTAPIPEAQIVETWVMNQMHVQSVLATKGARIVTAAGDRPVLDFGLRRIHGADNGLKAARAFHVSGVTGTSNVLAGRVYDLPISGTMAHSYVQAHDDELDAFRRFVGEWPDTVLLVDTYDTLAGVEHVIQLADELGDEFRVSGIRIDSGDLADLAKQARQRLDQAGLDQLSIFVSGGLDEFEIRRMLDDGVPIDGFGVGTAMGVSPDAPDLDIAYKLVEYAGEGRMKLSSGKPTLPGAKQVFRCSDNGCATGDLLARRDERLDGTPMLIQLIIDGCRVRDRDEPDAAREHARDSLRSLPASIRDIERAGRDYPVEISDALQAERDRIAAAIQSRARKTNPGRTHNEDPEGTPDGRHA
jgi:nicotinate phosphoribosyltransferase